MPLAKAVFSEEQSAGPGRRPWRSDYRARLPSREVVNPEATVVVAEAFEPSAKVAVSVCVLPGRNSIPLGGVGKSDAKRTKGRPAGTEKCSATVLACVQT